MCPDSGVHTVEGMKHSLRCAHPAARAAAVAVALTLTGCSSPEIDVPADFGQPLMIPPLAESHVDASGTRIFDLTARGGTTEFTAAGATETMGYNGTFLGPTLRAARGEKVAVNVTNSLAEATSVHWHGMHLPAAMDGGPHQEVAPGATWRPEWIIDQPAATLWYHPHPHGRTEEQVYRGLAGMFILDDPDTASSGLPGTYGVDDIPLIVQDKQFTADGQWSLKNDGNEIGVLGSTTMVNGSIGAVQQVTTEQVRLRLLNGSTARIYNFGFANDRPFQVVATDGGLLQAPLERRNIQLSPGERAEIVLSLAPGEETMLRSSKPDLGAVAASFAFGGEDSFDLLKLQAAPVLQPSAKISPRLATFAPDEEAASVTRSFTLAGREINGRKMDMDRIDQTVALGATEIWEVRSRNSFPHNFHIHDVQFQILSIDGAEPPEHLAGRKDTVYLSPRKTYRLIMSFEDYADPDVPFMYHCHLLLHEDEGMMGQFTVTDPAADAGVSKPGPDHDRGHAGHRH
ncbi:FtsP/CotA-like multicopper oxidase with cupredoxin domain [Arthrobacter pascens]|nr:FtsP/CotA-like multicopper oxidase with cupredoxin domain [Arthrobacter pascens]